MRSLSMTRTLVDSQRSLLRFPLVLLSAATAAVSAIHLIGHSHEDGPAVRVMMAAVLGIPLLISVTLGLEKGGKQNWPRRLGGIAALLVPILYYLLLPEELPQSHVIRFSVLFLGGHFLVSVAPFLRHNPGQALWQFNKTLLFRLVSSLLFTLVMYAGLSLALAALDNLLGVSLPNDVYAKLFVLLGFVFNTWFFLGGVPEAPLALADDVDFPRPLRVFSQHILSTLVVVYLAILLAYLVKVILTGVWPSGWIGWLVSGVAVAGLLSVVLLSPLQGSEDSRWVGLYFRIFHILMLPSVVMLVLAVSKRINQYGVTELRYILLVLSGWLLMVLLHGLWAKQVPVKAIALSLTFLAVAISLGPWGAVSLSLRSQKGRLAGELSAAGLLVDDQLVPTQDPSVPVSRSEIKKSFQYLIQRYGLSELDNWLTDEMRSKLKEAFGDGEKVYRQSGVRAGLIVDELGLSPEKTPEHQPLPEHMMAGDGLSDALPVGGFAYSLKLDLSSGTVQPFQWGNTRAEVGLSRNGDLLVLKKETEVLMEIPLGELFQDLPVATDYSTWNSGLQSEEMTFDYGNENLKVRLFVFQVVYDDGSERSVVNHLTGLLSLGEVAGIVPGNE
jgi:Domain of unknown function (DUF4153)